MPFFILWTTEWSSTRLLIPCYLYIFIVFLFFLILECDVQINIKTSSIFTSLYKCYCLSTLFKFLVEQGQLPLKLTVFLFFAKCFFNLYPCCRTKRKKGQIQVFASQAYLYFFLFLLNVFLICIHVVSKRKEEHLNSLPLSFLVYSILDKW